MEPNVKAIIYNIGGRLWDYAFSRMTTGRGTPLIEQRIDQIQKVIDSLPPDSEGNREISPALMATEAPEPETPASTKSEDIATACVACALGHFSRSAGALNEAMRFKGEGMTSNEILDRIASVLEELNALERFDLTPEKLQRTPKWEREIAEEALLHSRQLRHRLEGIQSIEELEQAAAETAAFYKKMNREWYKGRFRNLGTEKAEAISQRVGAGEK